MLHLRDIHAGYGPIKILTGVSFDVGAGEVVALIGRNGMGKTTTIRTIFGVLHATAGTIAFEGRPLAGLAPYQVSRRGLALAPEGRSIFVKLTVRENLIATAVSRPGGWTLARIYELFPRLAERADNLGSQLSGGEQQMLAIGRALMTNPKLLVLDEATEGLAPSVRQTIWSALTTIKSLGQSILIVDKHIADLARICDRFVVMEKGTSVWSGNRAEFQANHREIDARLSA